MRQAKSPLIVALDFPNLQPAVELLKQLEGLAVGMFKVGSELFSAVGPSLVLHIVGLGHEVFLDLKFHDIPHTVAGAAGAATRLGVSLLNVHAAGGMAMMRAAAGAVREVSPDTRVVAVTVLTSLSQDDLGRAGVAGTPQEQVLRLAEMAAEAGLDGVVASPQEAAALRRRFPQPFLLVTPGVRPAWTLTADDQKRVATPAEALAAGADYIVVGRPIIAAPDPREAVARILEELAQGR